PTIEYDGTARSASQPWSAGKSVSIRNANGGLTITSDSASATDIEVSGIPFTRDGTSETEKASATAHLSAMSPPSVGADATGNVSINAPGGGVDGYKLTVRLPALFDGVLAATNGNGNLSYSGTLVSVGNSLLTDNGDLTATLGAGSKIVVSASTDLGTV